MPHDFGSSFATSVELEQRDIRKQHKQLFAQVFIFSVLSIDTLRLSMWTQYLPAMPGTEICFRQIQIFSKHPKQEEDVAQ